VPGRIDNGPVRERRLGRRDALLSCHGVCTGYVGVSLYSAMMILCPDCPAALSARSMVLSEGFWILAWAAMLPFVLALIVVRRIVRHLDRGRA
jgi:hypothetical protein